MWHVWESGYVSTEFWWGDLWERDQLEDLGGNGSIILKWISIFDVSLTVPHSIDLFQ